MYYLDAGDQRDTRFRNAVFLALAAHAALVLGVSFSVNNTESYAPQIEVTLAHRPSETAPEDASRIAQANQEGSGDEAPLDQFSSRNNLPADTPSQEQALLQAPQEQIDLQQDTLSTTSMARHVVNTDQMEPEQKENHQKGISPEVDRLSQEIATLEAELEDEAKTFADRPRVRRLNASSARQSVDAAYLLDWRRRLEAVGNQYYPQASVRYGIYGDLRMLVVIRQDGSLEDIQVLSSSGYAVLDEAAIKIVRMAAPYSPFPAELKATTDKLEIVRTWHFQENQLSSP
jgi:protein TonB